MDKFVTVPEVLPDSLKDEFLKDSIAAAMSPIKREMLWCNINRHHEKVVAHFKAHAPVSDDAKERAKLLALIPVFSKELPNKVGFWWHRSGTLNISEVRCIYFSLNDQCFKCSAAVSLREMGGYWAECVAPELPKGEG